MFQQLYPLWLLGHGYKCPPREKGKQCVSIVERVLASQVPQKDLRTLGFHGTYFENHWSGCNRLFLCPRACWRLTHLKSLMFEHFPPNKNDKFMQFKQIISTSLQVLFHAPGGPSHLLKFSSFKVWLQDSQV